MATGLKSRVIYREKSSATGANYWAGDYKLLIRAKSIPSPFGDKNMVDTSTLEDLVETQEPGRRAANNIDIQGAFEKSYKDDLVDLEDKPLDIIFLYGTDGKGSEGVLAFQGSESFAPDEATDEHLTGTCKIAMSTVPKWIEDSYTVTVTEDELGYPAKITLTAKSS